MARKSKPLTEKEKTPGDEATDAGASSADGPEVSDESSKEEPLILESDAIEVTEVSTDCSEIENEAASDDSIGDVTSTEIDAVDAAEGEKPDGETDVGSTNGEATFEGEASEGPAQAEAKSGSGATSLFAMLIGGILAGGIGYYTATQFPPRPPSEPVDLSELTEGVSSNAGMLEELSARIDAIPSSDGTVDLGGVEAGIEELRGELSIASESFVSARDELKTSIENVRNALAALEQKVSELELGAGSGTAPTTDEDIAAFREEIDQITADAEARLAEAQQKAAAAEAAAAEARAVAEAEVAKAQEAAARQARIIDLKAAVENGAPFADLLSDLGEVPDVLAANAEDGIATLGDLQRGYPNAARAALAVSETIPDTASAGERFTAFLRRQTNARSLTPQDGDGADAVLSRAEGFLGEGDLAAVLEELKGLPDVGQSAMSDWLIQANARVSVLNAINSLSATN